MSNVLIGIIGVILFIGIALAGALILGGDFLTASNSSQAAKYIAQTQQVAHAAGMWEIKLGRKVETTGDISFLRPRFLKTVPSGYSINRWNSNAAVVHNRIADTPSNRQICEEIQRQTGIIADNESFYETRGDIYSMYTSHPTGCRIWTDGRIAIWVAI